MEKNNGFESQDDDDLQTIVRSVMDKDYRVLIDYLVEQKYGNFSAPLAEEFETGCLGMLHSFDSALKKLKKLLLWSRLEEAAELCGKDIFEVMKRFIGEYGHFLKYTPEFQSQVALIMEHENIDEEANLIRVRDLLPQMIKSAPSLSLEKLNDEKSQYRRRLSDHMYLLDCLIDLLKAHYNKKILQSRTRFESLARSHKANDAAVRDELASVHSQLLKLAEDKILTQPERAKLVIAFQAKQSELEQISEREAGRFREMKALADNVLRGFDGLKQLIHALKTQRDSFQARKEYLNSLSEIERKIPSFNESTDLIQKAFGENSVNLEKEIMFCDNLFQEKILNTIDRQEKVNRIVLSGSAALAEELKLEFPEKIDFDLFKPIGD